MVTVNQVQQGLARYIDTELMSKMDGWQKWVFGAGAALALEQLPQIMEQYRENPTVKMLGVFDEAGHVDIDRVYRNILPQARKGAATITLPMIGAVTVDEGDVERLYQMIISA